MIEPFVNSDEQTKNETNISEDGSYLGNFRRSGGGGEGGSSC